MKHLGWVDLASGLAYVTFLVLGIVRGKPGPTLYIGVALSLVCAVLWVVARVQLGASFSASAQARHLVTTGLYSRIRHPIYVFGTLAFMGAVLAIMGWQALVVWAIVGVIQVGRAMREDKVLAEAFGEEYEEYRKRTWL